MNTLRVLFYLRKNYVNKDGKTSIMVRVTVNGVRVQFSSKIDIEPHLWNVDASRVIGRSAEVRRINDDLDNIKISLTNHYRNIANREVTVTAEKVRNAFMGITPKGETLMQIFDKYIEDGEKLIGISKAKATIQKYQVTKKRLFEFMNHRYKISDINIKEVNHMFITDFEIFLRSVKGCNANTASKFLQFLKTITIVARNNGWLAHDPYVNYRIKKQAVDRGYLTKEEIAIIAQKELVSERLDQVRDVFLFSCFTDLSLMSNFLKTNNLQIANQ